MERLIAHVDMDCFYAAVEVMDDLSLKGKPVIVGADPRGGEGRGVVSAASYEARTFGVHSAMPVSTAYRLCPHGVFLPGRMRRYEEVSDRIMEILGTFTPLIQQISVDEAFLDLSRCRRILGTPEIIGRKIKDRIRQQTGLTASVGMGSNKLVAKVASDLKKPDGLVIVPAGTEAAFLAPLPLRKLWGIGPKTEEKLKSRFRVETIGQLAALPEEKLEKVFGVMGSYLHQRAIGADDEPVSDEHQAKSIGREHTYDQDTGNREELLSTLLYLCDDVASRIRAGGARPKTLTLKLRYSGFETHTYSHTPGSLSPVTRQLFGLAKELLLKNWEATRKIRLIGISASNFGESPQQTGLFDQQESGDAKAQRVEQAVDKVRKKLGRKAIVRAGTLDSKRL
jgi:nucleotidyltransferase/DNA polymerase involved in DNA repair